MIVSVRDQRLLLVCHGKPIKSYKISTSKFGIGDRNGSYCTPLGRMEVSRKIGDNAPAGAVFKRRQLTGEVIRPDAPGRDPIVSRILWLRGTEAANRHAFARCRVVYQFDFFFARTIPILFSFFLDLLSYSCWDFLDSNFWLVSST